MKKQISKFIVTAALVISSTVSANALVDSSYNLDLTIQNLDTLASADLNVLVNKSDLVGERRQNFDLLTAQYLNEVRLARQNLINIQNQLNISSASDSEASDSSYKTGKLYQEAEAAIFDLESKTINYLYSIQVIMPTVSYQKYSKKFRAFYNSFNFTNNEIK